MFIWRWYGLFGVICLYCFGPDEDPVRVKAVEFLPIFHFFSPNTFEYNFLQDKPNQQHKKVQSNRHNMKTDNKTKMEICYRFHPFIQITRADNMKTIFSISNQELGDYLYIERVLHDSLFLLSILAIK